MAAHFWFGYDDTFAELDCALCKKSERIGRLFRHAVTCPTDFHRNGRHKLVGNEVRNFLKHAGIATQAQEGRISGTFLRPGDVVGLRQYDGRDGYHDIAIKDPLSNPPAHSDTDPRLMHLNAERAKRNKNNVESLCKNAGIEFVPLIASTYGVWSELAISTFASIAHRAALLHDDDEDRKVILRRFYQRLSFIIIQCNARMILDRRPNLRDYGLSRRYGSA